MRKMRLLSLASLGAESNEVPYALIAQTLQIPEEDVEMWIIDAVSAKLIEAKLNQVKRVANVRYVAELFCCCTKHYQLLCATSFWRSTMEAIGYKT